MARLGPDQCIVASHETILLFHVRLALRGECLMSTAIVFRTRRLRDSSEQKPHGDAEIRAI
ncbi:MAG: hypothetical protein DMF90_20920 [Acidobacteria bacterium]|nr:MAG: hypothetical protein DMF90_20920 [Acidobacteriota bacterium]